MEEGRKGERGGDEGRGKEVRMKGTRSGLGERSNLCVSVRSSGWLCFQRVNV